MRAGKTTGKDREQTCHRGAILASALAASTFASTVDLSKTTIKAAYGSEVPVEIARPEVGETWLMKWMKLTPQMRYP